MHKLVILIEPQEDWNKFEQDWPKFLKLAENMPGLMRETSTPIQRVLHGKFAVSMIHELYFNNMDDLRIAMDSPQGQEAGKILQIITGGQVTLLFGDHLEDELANIRTHQTSSEETDPLTEDD